MPIRKMTEGDIPQVLALQQELAFQDWNEKQYLSEIRASYALCCVYTADETPDKILGYAVFHMLGPDSELLSIATQGQSQGKGIGGQLLQEAFGQLDFSSGDQVFLEVREGNSRARRFYEHHGFESYSIRKNYYSDGENAVLYRKSR